MMTDRLNSGEAHKSGKQCPPDMPRGDSPEDKAARQRYWIERGNQLLAEMGKSHLHWVCFDGHYSIEERRV